MQDAPPATEQAEDEAAAAKKAADDAAAAKKKADDEAAAAKKEADDDAAAAKKKAEDEANRKEEEANRKEEEAKSKAAEEARRQVRSKDSMRRDRSQLPSSFVPFASSSKKIVVVLANQVLLWKRNGVGCVSLLLSHSATAHY